MPTGGGTAQLHHGDALAGRSRSGEPVAAHYGMAVENGIHGAVSAFPAALSLPRLGDQVFDIPRPAGVQAQRAADLQNHGHDPSAPPRCFCRQRRVLASVYVSVAQAIYKRPERERLLVPLLAADIAGKILREPVVQDMRGDRGGFALIVRHERKNEKRFPLSRGPRPR